MAALLALPCLASAKSQLQFRLLALGRLLHPISKGPTDPFDCAAAPQWRSLRLKNQADLAGCTGFILTPHFTATPFHGRESSASLVLAGVVTKQ